MQDRIPDRVDSKFRFVLLAAHRAEQMMRGARPRIENVKSKYATTAMEEILNDRVAWDYGPAPQHEPEEAMEAAEEETETVQEVN